MTLRRPSLSIGLSPRERGNHRTAALAPHRQRSIPARAGEPGNPKLGEGVYTVYPRASGGTTPEPTSPPVVFGLSPRERGNQA